MNVNPLSNDSLHHETLAAAAREKSATLALLELLAEVDRRRLYSARGYASLWEYVHLALGYSEASASERVSAMRLMQRVPKVKTELAENRLTLTAASKLATFVRREKCSPEKVTELLLAVTEKSTREVERVLASHQTLPATKPDFVRPTGPGSMRVAFDADSEFLVLFEELKNLQGRTEWGMNERLKEAMRELIARKKKIDSKGPLPKNITPKDLAPVRASVQTSVQISAPVQTLAPARVRAPERRKPSRYIPIRTRKATIERSDRQCEFVDPVTKRRCASRFGLQYDHIRPFAKGGSAEPRNIRHLCVGTRRSGSLESRKSLRPAFRPVGWDEKESCYPISGPEITQHLLVTDFCY